MSEFLPIGKPSVLKGFDELEGDLTWRGKKLNSGTPGRDGVDGHDGADGISPVVTKNEIEGGYRITFTDATHPDGQSIDILNGVNGRDGADGADGENASDVVTSVDDLDPDAEDGRICIVLGNDRSTIYVKQNGSWQTLNVDSHEHVNLTALGKIAEKSGLIAYNGKVIGVQVTNTIPPYSADLEYGRIIYFTGQTAFSSFHNGLLFYDKPNGWIQLTEESFSTWYRDHAATLARISAPNGSLLYNGNPVGVSVVSSPELLPVNAPDGSVAVATESGTIYTPVELPDQIAGEQVEADISGTELAFGVPTYNGSAVQAAINAADVSASAQVSITADGSYDGGVIELSLMPVVADISDNDYTAAGITLDAESSIISQNATKDYAILAMLTSSGTGLIKPSEIIQVDSTHISVPGVAILTFESVTGSIAGMVTGTLHAGWNLVRVTLEFDSGGSFVGVSGAELVEDITDINEYFDLRASAANSMTVEGTSASQLMSGVISCKSTLPMGLYVKLGSWKRMIGADE